MPNPYEDPKTGIPFNRLGIDDKETLHLRETMAVAKRLLQLRKKPIEGEFDTSHLQAIHKHLLQDVYDWAGQFRTMSMRNSRSRVPFAEPEEIIPKLQAISDRLKEQNLLAGLSKDQFSMKAAQLLRDINAVHAFPDGNGRTQREIVRTLGVQAGYKIDWNYQTENQVYQFNKASRLAHNDGNLIGLAHIMRNSTTELPIARQASHKVRDERNLTNTPTPSGLSASASSAQEKAARERSEHDLKLLSPYLPGGRIPDNAKAHGDLRFWQVKEGDQVTKYAVGVLSHPDGTKPVRDQKAQSSVSRGTGFDAGHLIGHQFGGPEIAANLSLQNPTLNQGGGNWYKMESRWADDLRNDNRVAVVVKEVTRPDTPNFLWRSVDSLTINLEGKVRHDELSMLNPETERAVAAQGRTPAPEVPGGAEIYDLRPTFAARDQIEQAARDAAEERLARPEPAQVQPTGYKRVLAQLQSWRGQSKENDIKEPEGIGTLGPGPEGKTQKEADAEREANERLQKMRKDQAIPQLDKMTWTAHPKTGDVTYSLSGKAAFIDRGKAITVLQPEAVATRVALEMAVQKYGRSIDATGTPAFQKQILQAALEMRAEIVFTDPKIQARFVAAREELQKLEAKTKAEEIQRNLTKQAASKSASAKEGTPQVKVSDREAAAVPDPERTFTKHAEALRQRYGFGLDAEKADGIVALKMAQTGWQPEDIAAALKTRRLNMDLSAPNEIDAYAKKLTIQAVGRAAREAIADRTTSMDMGR